MKKYKTPDDVLVNSQTKEGLKSAKPKQSKTARKQNSKNTVKNRFGNPAIKNIKK